MGGATIPGNPLDGMPLPTTRKRSAEVVVVSDAESAASLSLVQSLSTRDLLTVAWETGTRPVNLYRATAAKLTARTATPCCSPTGTRRRGSPPTRLSG